MASKSETGHAKNVANFEDLLSFCAGYETNYNPSREELGLTVLNNLHQLAVNSLKTVKDQRQEFTNATNARQLVFEGYKAYSTRIFNAIASSGASRQLIADAQTINKKIQGVKASSTKKVETAPTDENAAPPTDKTISVSQQSYDSIIDHFTKLIVLAEKETKYKPNETDLKVESLQTKLDKMKAANTVVINALTAWSNAMISRNTILYAPVTGLVDITKDVKKYVKSVFGAASPQFKQINSIEFKVVKSKK